MARKKRKRKKNGEKYDQIANKVNQIQTNQ